MTSRVSEKGQVTIPKALSSRFGIRAGEEVTFREVRRSRATRSAGPRSSSDDIHDDVRAPSGQVCDVVWPELSPAFSDPAEASTLFERYSIEFSGMSPASAGRAGHGWRAYRRAGGPRDRIISDFLIAGHAFEHADALLTRDRGFARAYFAVLTTIDPSAES